VPADGSELCSVCGNDKLTLHSKGHGHAVDPDAFGSSRTKISVGDVLRCDVCGFAFTRVRPDGERLAELYRNLDADVYEAEAPGRLKTAWRHLKILHNYAAPPGRLLDVGCASGLFLGLATDAGWESVGIEPSTVLWERARRELRGRAEVLHCMLQTASIPATSFSVVTMWDVLEHVPHPREFLTLASSLLKKGGMMLLNVPNFDSLQARVFKRSWPLLLPEHLNYFNRRSLHQLAKTAGLELVAFGSRPAVFTLKYIIYRLSQHGFPGASALERFCSQSALGDWLVPIFMGEIYSVWHKAE
jgi:2-polyprenyl-3-methyl-5-hydroxy-6-metoxy-1,4-benzoquinol methylase